MVFGSRSQHHGITTVVDQAIAPVADTVNTAGERNFDARSTVADDVGAVEGGDMDSGEVV